MDELKNIIGVFDEAANTYQDKFMDVQLYKNTLNIFCAALPKTAKILELGCGPGNITTYLLNRRSDLDILATDMASEMLKLAAINCPMADYRLMDSREIYRLEEKYDGMVCGFIFPYLTKGELANFIKDAAERLNKDGLLYLSTMIKEVGSGVYETSSSDGKYTLFINYHSRDFLIENLKENGFVIFAEEVVRKDKEADLDLLIIARLIEN